MNYNILENVEYCGQIVTELTSLLLYSHIPTALIALVAGFYVFTKGSRSLSAKVFFAITVTFSIWSFLDLFIWFNYDQASLLMYAWSPIELVSALMFVLALYFTYVFLDRKDLPNWVKIVIFLGLLPIIIFSPTSHNLLNYDIQECIATEGGWYSSYLYYFKVIISLWILILPIQRVLTKKTIRTKKEVTLITFGLLTFIFSFLGSGYVASLTQNFLLEIYGLFAMIVFILTLFYAIVTFKIFNIKIIATQLLVIIVISLIASQFFYIKSDTNFLLNLITLILTIVFGLILIKSVKREIEQKEKIEKLVEELEKANEQQSNLIRFISHQVKGFFTKSRIIFSMLSEGEFGKLPQKAKEAVDKGLQSDVTGINMVQEVLRASDLKKGKTSYQVNKCDVTKILSDVIFELKERIEEKKLNVIKDGLDKKILVDCDELYFKEVFVNLIDNAIRYTKEGSITVRLSDEGENIKVTIKDTGIGIDKEDFSRLFTEGGKGADSQKINVDSTGYGLFIAKKIVTAHQGTINVYSEGINKGTEFVIVLPKKHDKSS